ncbi:tyrosine-type recombinase/integrase [Candidatus Microgenomates bacterium]|nr:tyrosine-type recombinase/integrase [Candidatus Microgenomates bacterium]
MNLNDLIRQFLEHLEVERGKSLKTIENYQHYLNRFLIFAEGLGVKEPTQIDQDVIRQYRLYLNRLTNQKGEMLRKVTQNYHSIALRAFLKYLAKRDIKSLSAEKVELAKQEDREVSFLDAQELERLMASPAMYEKNVTKRMRDEAILHTLFSTGLRVSELCSLNREQVDLERGEFSVRGKGSKIRVVFLSNEAKEFLRKYLERRKDNHKAVFVPVLHKVRGAGNSPTSDVGEKIGREMRLTSRSVERLIAHYAKLAGIIKKVSPHTLRHCFATDLLMNGADIRSVQSMLGHSSITTTQIYTHVTNQQLRDVHRAFHGKTKK